MYSWLHCICLGLCEKEMFGFNEKEIFDCNDCLNWGFPFRKQPTFDLISEWILNCLRSYKPKRNPLHELEERYVYTSHSTILVSLFNILSLSPYSTFYLCPYSMFCPCFHTQWTVFSILNVLTGYRSTKEESHPSNSDHWWQKVTEFTQEVGR